MVNFYIYEIKNKGEYVWIENLLYLEIELLRRNKTHQTHYIGFKLYDKEVLKVKTEQFFIDVVKKHRERFRRFCSSEEYLFNGKFEEVHCRYSIKGIKENKDLENTIMEIYEKHEFINSNMKILWE